MPEPMIFSTEDWGAQPPHGHFATKLAEGIVVHNTQGANRAPGTTLAKEKQAAFAVARQIQQDHFHRHPHPFGDTGQHFTISRGGLILEGRHGSLAAAKSGKVVRGAHADSPHNRANQVLFGIEVEGDNRVEVGGDHVTDKQFKALIELCAWLSFWGHFDSSHIQPHLDVEAGHTDCPGLFANRIPDLIAAVHDRKVEIIQSHN